jgi:hypothetical protein
MSQLNMVAGADNCTAPGMAEYHDHFRTYDFGGEFHTTQNVRVQDIAGDADTEEITQPLVKNQLGRRAAVDTAQYGSKRKLAGRSFVDLLKQIAVCFQVVLKSLIALF